MKIAEKLITILQRADRFLVPSLFVVHICLVIAFAAIIDMTMAKSVDLFRYYELAEALRHGSFSLPSAEGVVEPEGVRSFGMPVLIIFSEGLFGPSMIAVVIVQCILYLASVFFVYRLTVGTFGRVTGVVFLTVAAIYPFIVIQAAIWSPETPCLFLITSAFYLFDRFSKSGRFAIGFALLGCLTALTVYFRSNLAPLPFFLGLILFLRYPQHRLRIPALFAAAILVMTPATIYYYHNFGSVTPVPVYGGGSASLWMATWHSRVGTPDMLQYTRTLRISENLRNSGMFEQMEAANRKIGIDDKWFPMNMGIFPNNQVRAGVESEYRRLAIENIRSEPVSYLRQSIWNAARMWFPFYLHDPSTPLPVIIRFVGISVFVLGFLGLFVAFRSFPSDFFVIAAGAVMILHTMTICWLHTEARYTIPARLFLVAFAAYALHLFYALVRSWVLGRGNWPPADAGGSD